MRMYYAGLATSGGLSMTCFVTTFATVRARLWKTRGALSTGIGSGAPLARIVAECAVCGHGSNHVTALAYSVNRDNTGDWRCGDLGDRSGVMAGAEHAATKSPRGIAATGHTGFPKTKKSARSSQKQ
jgi:hypothetical protein